MAMSWRSWSPAVLLASAVIYQVILKDILWVTLGYGRKLDNLESFGVRCERITGLGLEACEDMWLHEGSGLLYVACSDSVNKAAWNPSVARLNVSGRRLTDKMGVIDTRAPGPVSDRLRWITPIDYLGTNRNGVLDLQGFDVQVVNGDPPTLRILLVNNRPPIDSVTGVPLDPFRVGSNSTIELFETVLGSTQMRHLKTYHDSAIQTPNNVAFIDGKGDEFVTTNDKSAPYGFRRKLDGLLGGGSVTYCNRTSCHMALSSGFNYPNGLIRGPDGLIYVPSVITGEIHVLEFQVDHMLRRVHVISTGYPIDNLSQDSKGDIFAAAFPMLHQTVKTFDDAWAVNPPATVLRIRRLEGEGFVYAVEKVLEDDGSVLPGATTAVHDPGQPERWFLGGFISPFITVCEAQ